jgi:hypothetical protein
LFISDKKLPKFFYLLIISYIPCRDYAISILKIFNS